MSLFFSLQCVLALTNLYKLDYIIIHGGLLSQDSHLYQVSQTRTVTFWGKEGQNSNHQPFIL